MSSGPRRATLHTVLALGASLAAVGCDASRGGSTAGSAAGGTPETAARPVAASVASGADSAARAAVPATGAVVPAVMSGDTVTTASAGTVAPADTGNAAAGTKAKRPSNVTRNARTDSLWRVRQAAPVAPGSILPAKRIIAYYGNPNSKRMGVLGEYEASTMLAKLDREVAAWNRADPSKPVQPALHLVATVAQGAAGEDGMWRRRESPKIIDKVYGWAQSKRAIMFLDVQIGKSTVEEEVRHLMPYLQRPDVHLGIDPEFAMTKGGEPGKRVGTYDASHINRVIDMLAATVTQYKLPPKVLVVHRFTGPMVTNASQIKLDPRVQVVMHMDGWGPPYGKRATWSRFIYPHPVQYTGFKLFYHNDTKAGHPLMKPSDVLAVWPAPVYIQYQ